MLFIKLLKNNSLKNQEGVAILISLLLVSALLAIVLTLSAIFIPKIMTSSEAKNSSAALYAAESGIEWCLQVRKGGSPPQPIMSNGATYLNGLTQPPSVLTSADCSGATLKVIGNFQGPNRALEVTP